MAELLPLFPLHTVLFPGGVLPLHVFEDRYRLLIQQRLDFGIVMIREGREVESPDGDDGEPFLHEVGTIAHPERVEALPEGRYNVLVRGIERFGVGPRDSSRPYLQARREELPDVDRCRPRLAPLLQEYLQAHGVEVLLQHSEEFARRGTWLAGSLLQVEPAKLQRLLESGDSALAEQMLIEELDRLHQIGRLGTMQPRRVSPN